MEWISVDERLPEDRVSVLVWNKDSVEIGFMSKGKWQSWVEFYRGVTHWMPLPEAPNEGDTKITPIMIDVPCSITMPCKLELNEDFSLDGNKYEFYIFAGVKPDNIGEKPICMAIEGMLLCKVVNKGPAPIIADGIASYFVIIRNGKEVAGHGNIGTSGCPMIVPNTNFVRDDFFTIDNIF